MSIYRVGTYRNHGDDRASVIAVGKGHGYNSELAWCATEQDAVAIVGELMDLEHRDEVLTRAMAELMAVVLTEPISETVKFKKMAEIVQGCSDELRGISHGG